MLESSVNSRIQYIENTGQFDSAVKFVCQAGGQITWLCGQSFIQQIPVKAGVWNLRATFVGSNEPQIERIGKSTAIYNFFLGNDRSKWREGLSAYDQVLFRELYQGIDLRFREGDGAIEYDLIVSPGANFSDIQLSFEGAEALSIEADGRLKIIGPSVSAHHSAPIVFQDGPEGRKFLESRYILLDQTTCGFEVLGNIDPQLSVVIDPQLMYSTYLGGGGRDEGFAVAAGIDGTVTTAFRAKSFLYPMTTGETHSGGDDTCVVRLRTRGTGQFDLLNSTFVGGSQNDQVTSMDLDPDTGNIVIVGQTDSVTDYPKVPQGVMGQGARDVFVSLLTKTGSLISSTYLGGSGNSDLAYGVTFGQSDGMFWRVELGYTCSLPPVDCYPPIGKYIYVAGATAENDFPTTPGAFDESFNFLGDAFVAIFTPNLNDLAYCTFVGSAGVDAGYGIAVDPVDGTFVLAGGAQHGPQPWLGAAGDPDCGEDFPLKNAWDTTFEGGLPTSTYSEGFLVKILPNPDLGNAGPCILGSQTAPVYNDQLIFSTFAGGGRGGEGNHLQEYCFDVVIDGNSNIYVVGTTPASDWPATAASGTFPDPQTLHPLSAADGGVHHDPNYADYDGFVFSVNAVGALRFATTFAALCPLTTNGSAGYEWIYGVRLSPDGSIWIAGHTPSVDLPVTVSGDGMVHADINDASHQAAFQEGCGHDYSIMGELDKDIFVAQLRFNEFATPQPTMTLEYCRYIGGGSNEYLNAMDLDASGNLYLVGYTGPIQGTPSFPTTSGSFAPNPIGSYDAILVRIEVGPKFVRGDLDQDGIIGPDDLVMLRDLLKPSSGISSIACMDSADLNDDGVLDMADFSKLAGSVSGYIGGSFVGTCELDKNPDAFAFCQWSLICP